MDAFEVAEWAARAAVAIVGPRAGNVDDVYAAGCAAAWEAVALGSVRSRAGARQVAVRAGRQAEMSMRSWLPDWEVRRGTIVTSRVWSYDMWDADLAGDVLYDAADRVWGVPASSDLAVELGEVLAGVVEALAGAGMDRELAEAAVQAVVDDPPTHPRIEARLRSHLVDELRLDTIAARALVILLMGYPRQHVPGLIERELTGAAGWSHPCVAWLVEVVARPRPTRLDRHRVWAIPVPVVGLERAAA